MAAFRARICPEDMALPIRRSVAARPTRRVERASFGISRTRLAAALVLLVSTAGMYGLTTADAFAVDPRTVTVEGLRHTQATAALGALGLADGSMPDLFRISTTELAEALRALPAVRDATVETELPNVIRVTVVEREPIIMWRYPSGARLVDVEGVDLAPATGQEGLPLVEDGRSGATPVPPGTSIAGMDLEVARLLGSIEPSDLGSSAPSLALSVTDAEGWVLETAEGWRAIFGHYTPTLRPPSSIAMQVACLSGILAQEGEETIRAVALSLSDDGCGTYLPVPDPTVEPAVSPRPSRSPPP